MEPKVYHVTVDRTMALEEPRFPYEDVVIDDEWQHIGDDEDGDHIFKISFKAGNQRLLDGYLEHDDRVLIYDEKE